LFVESDVVWRLDLAPISIEKEKVESFRKIAQTFNS